MCKTSIRVEVIKIIKKLNEFFFSISPYKEYVVNLDASVFLRVKGIKEWPN